MADGKPKNYSRMFHEERLKPLDGTFEAPRHREFNHQNAADFCNQVSAKLEAIALANSSADLFAEKELRTHFKSVTNSRNRSAIEFGGSGFKVHVQYFDLKETLVMRVARNDLGSIIERLPKRGNYRYFFKRMDNMCEEIESIHEKVPVHENDRGVKQIFCQIFPAF